MSTGVLISEKEYLSTAYEPDCEFEDGVVIERNVGEKSHSWLQVEITLWLGNHRKLWNIEVFTELRHRVRPGKYMIPDICVFRRPSPAEEVMKSPPLIWIEVLSPADRPLRVTRKVRQLLDFGVPNIWVIDPETLESEIHTPRGVQFPEDGILRVEGTPIELPLFELERP